MNRNVVLFIVFAFLFILIWFFLIVPNLTPTQTQPQTGQQTTQQQTQTQVSEQPVQQSTIPPPTVPPTEKPPVGPTDANKTQFVETVNPVSSFDIDRKAYLLTMSSNNGAATSALLPPQAGKTEKNQLVSQKSEFSRDMLSTFIGKQDFTTARNIDFKIDKISDDEYLLTKTVLDDNGKKVEISKRIDFTDTAEMSVSIEIKGIENNIPKFSDDKLFVLLGLGPYLGPDSLYANTSNKTAVMTYFNKNYTSQALKKNKPVLVNDFEWFSLSNIYFAVIVKKDNVSSTDLHLFSTGANDGRVFLTARPFELVDNVYKFKVYLVTKIRSEISAYDKTFARLSQSGGPLYFLVLAFDYLLEFFYKLIKNWGIAIILLAILIKLLLLPLTRKSTISMKRMALLNPQIKEIQQKYKDNQAKANAEMQALYKRENVNPLSSCLPLLLQFPFLIALYNSLQYNIQLNGATFLWIKNLSMPESILTLSFSLPLIGSAIRLLPIFMLLTQIVQTIFQMKSQTGSTPEQEMQQKLMAWLMPIIFFFILYNMSSGLVLYWTFLNIFSIFEMLIINRSVTVKSMQVKATGK